MTTLSIVPTSQGDALIVDGAALLCVVKTPPEGRTPDPKSAYMQGRNICKTAAIQNLRHLSSVQRPGQELTARRTFTVGGRTIPLGNLATVVNVRGDYATIRVENVGPTKAVVTFELALDRVSDYFFPE